MSNALREIVELTKIAGFARKCVLLHMADTVRDKGLLFYRSHINMSKRLGTDAKVIRHNIGVLEAADLIQKVGDRLTPAGTISEYRIRLDSILALPSIELIDRRPDLSVGLGNKSKRGGVGVESPRGEGLRTLGGGVENPTIHNYPYLNHKAAKKTELTSRVEKSAGVDLGFSNGEDFNAWLAVKRSDANG